MLVFSHRNNRVWAATDMHRYSDVTHEVTEITSGYRLVLTYNLINVSPSAPVSATSLRAETRNLRAVFKAWNKDLDEAGDIGEECIYYLNHEYTEASLHYRALKGKDMAKARALKEVCDETGFCFFLATLERMVQGGCDESYDDFGYGFEEEYNSDEEEEYSGYSSCRTYGDHHDLTEIYQEELKLKRVVDLDGNIVAEDVAVDEEKILADAPYEDREPDAEDFSGFTGNEGVSATHWYRDAVSPPHDRLLQHINQMRRCLLSCRAQLWQTFSSPSLSMTTR